MDQRRLTENPRAKDSSRSSRAGRERTALRLGFPYLTSNDFALLLTTPGGSLACLQSPLLKLTTWIPGASIVEPVTIGPYSP